MHKKLIVIGGGPAGLAAAVSAVENGLSPEDICRIVMDSPNAAKAVNSLVNTALQRGGKDNVTIICAFFN